MPTRHVYAPQDRPLVQVLVDGTWCDAVVRMWTRRDNDQVVAQVTWTAAAGEHYIGDFPLEHVRPLDEQTGEPLDPASIWPWKDC